MEDFNERIIRSNTSYDKKRLAALVKAFGRSRYKLDGNAVSDDIAKLQDRIGTVKNKTWIAGANEIIEYLNKLLPYCDQVYDCSIRIGADDIKEFPIRIKRFPQFDVEAVEYIVIKSAEGNGGLCSIVSYNFDNMLDALAVEMTKFDFGLTMQDIESKLSDCNIIEVSDGNRVVDMLEYDDHSEPGRIFYTACEMAIDESEYVNRLKNKKYGSTYFKTEVKCNGKYRELLERTASEFTNILLMRHLSAFKNKKLNDVRLMTVSSGMITYGIDYKSQEGLDSVLDVLRETVEIKICGRTFSFKPDVEYTIIK